MSLDSASSTHVKAHYEAREDAGFRTRAASPIFHVKALNNWTKAVLFTLFCPPLCVGLDLCCGKGGDLNKWKNARAALVVGADIAHQSVVQAVERYNANARLPPFRFLPFSGDLCLVDLPSYLEEGLWFDFVSCQFAFHYSFETYPRALRMMRNAAERMKPGSYFLGTVPDDSVLVHKLRDAAAMSFGNDLFQVDFRTGHKGPFVGGYGHEYVFTLKDALDGCPEYLVPLEALRALGRECGLELLHHENLHEFFYLHSRAPQFFDLMRRMNVMPRGGHPFPADQWDICYLYRVFVFRKSTPASDIASTSATSSSSFSSSSSSLDSTPTYSSLHISKTPQTAGDPIQMQ